jgi:protein ImuA
MTAAHIERLRAEIRRLEGRAPTFAGTVLPAAAAVASIRPWSFGVKAIDDLLAGGLAADGLHEVTPGRYGDSWAAIAFGLALLARRTAAGPSKPLLWCFTPRQESELGRPSAPGLQRFGIDPARLILIGAANAAEAAFVLEEGLRCGRLAAALAGIDSLDATAARRLSLAAKAGVTPALLLTPPAAPGILTAASRWRVALPPAPQRPPGAPPRLHECAWHVELLRNRHGAAGGAFQLAFALADPLFESRVETSHEQAFRFRLPAAAGDRASAAA